MSYIIIGCILSAITTISIAVASRYRDNFYTTKSQLVMSMASLRLMKESRDLALKHPKEGEICLSNHLTHRLATKLYDETERKIVKKEEKG